MTETQTRLADDPQMPVAGSMVGDRYEVRSVLGEGGFAVVYRAFDARTKAEVAVKVLDPLMSRRREFASRFMREVETVSKLRHHNTISVYDAGETPNGCLYLVSTRQAMANTTQSKAIIVGSTFVGKVRQRDRIFSHLACRRFSSPAACVDMPGGPPCRRRAWHRLVQRRPRM